MLLLNEKPVFNTMCVSTLQGASCQEEDPWAQEAAGGDANQVGDRMVMS